MASQTHRKIAEHLRALADLFDDLSVEVTARKDYPSHGYQSAARELGVGVQRYSSVRLTENERRLVVAHCAQKKKDREARQEEQGSHRALLQYLDEVIEST
jgi:hypothetical protein